MRCVCKLFAFTMQHILLRADHMTFEGVGAGGGGYVRFQKKKKLQTNFEQKKNSGKEIPVIQWLCMSGKKTITRGLGKKKFLRKPNHPYPATKVKWWAPYLHNFETRPLINRVVNSLWWKGQMPPPHPPPLFLNTV